MLEYKFDTQLLIEGNNLDEDAINDYIRANIPGDCLIAVGDEDLIKNIRKYVDNIKYMQI